MSMGTGPWAAMHSFRRDSQVTAQKLKPGTVRRILAFARPYRRYISWFLVLVVIDAVLVVATPLIFAVIIDDGVGKGNSALVTRLAILRRAASPSCQRGDRPGAALLLLPHRRGPDLRPAHPRSSPTCSGCRSPSSPAPRPAR